MIYYCKRTNNNCLDYIGFGTHQENCIVKLQKTFKGKEIFYMCKDLNISNCSHQIIEHFLTKYNINFNFNLYYILFVIIIIIIY